MAPTFIGIDPGVSGAVAFIRGDECKVKPVPVLPGKPRRVDPDYLSSIVRLWAGNGPALAVVEKVHAMPGQGVASMFSFGVSFGTVLGVLGAVAVPVELVTPQRWKAAVLAGTAKDKGAAVAYCRRRFPGVPLLATPRCTKPHDGMADALCLAEYARRLYGGKS